MLELLMNYDISIIGSGPAGLTAAIYGARAGFKVAVFGGSVPFGQLMYTSEVENFPGIKHISGPSLMANMKEQIDNLNIDFFQIDIDHLGLGDGLFSIRSNDKEFFSRTCILATGSSAKWLEIPSESKFKGRGISTCATCDGFFYKNKVVAVVGGGNTALEDALVLSKIASKVFIIHRRNELRGEQILQDRVFKCQNVEVIWNSQVREFYGKDEVLNSILVENTETKELKKISVNGVFVAIGYTPQTHLVKGMIDLDKNGYVKSGPITSISGLFVAGDVHDNVYRQAVTAAADGCKAALECGKFIDADLKSCIVQEDARSIFVKKEGDKNRGGKKFDRKKSIGDESDSMERSYDKPRSSEGRSFGDRPSGSSAGRRFGDKSRASSGGRFGDKPRTGRPARSSDGERRFSSRPRSDESKSFGDESRSERPARNYDRPRVDGADKSYDRPARSYDKPRSSARRSSGSSSGRKFGDRPSGSSAGRRFGDKPRTGRPAGSSGLKSKPRFSKSSSTDKRPRR